MRTITFPMPVSNRRDSTVEEIEALIRVLFPELICQERATSFTS
jgi:hypothetical protein